MSSDHENKNNLQLFYYLTLEQILQMEQSEPEARRRPTLSLPSYRFYTCHIPRPTFHFCDLELFVRFKLKNLRVPTLLLHDFSLENSGISIGLNVMKVDGD